MEFPWLLLQVHNKLGCEKNATREKYDIHNEA